jgi:hypothetical protein
MSVEAVSIYAKSLLETLLNVHALANMARGADRQPDRAEYMKTAAAWLPSLERQMHDLRYWLEREQMAPEPATSGENISPEPSPTNYEIHKRKQRR